MLTLALVIQVTKTVYFNSSFQSRLSKAKQWCRVLLEARLCLISVASICSFFIKHCQEADRHPTHLLLLNSSSVHKQQFFPVFLEQEQTLCWNEAPPLIPPRFTAPTQQVLCPYISFLLQNRETAGVRGHLFSL